MDKIKDLPQNFDQLNIDQLQELLTRFNKTCKLNIKRITDRITALENQQNSILQAMIDLMPEKEYFQQIPFNRADQLEARIHNLKPEQIQQIISKTQVFENDFQIAFFQKYADQIIQANLQKYIKITYIDLEQRTKEKYFKIEPGLIKRIIDFYSDKGYLQDQIGSGLQDEYLIAFAVRAEIIDDVDEETKKKIEQLIQVQKEYNHAKRKGAYFNYLNKTVLDLSRYQIGNDYENHLKLSQQNCFIHCVQQCGKYGFDQIAHIISQLNSEVHEFSLKSIQKINGIGYIKVITYADDKKCQYELINKIDNKEPDVILGLYKEHFFIEEDLPISNFWIENYEKYKHMQKYLEQPNASQVRGNSISVSKSTLRTGQILKSLMTNGHFEEIKHLNQFNFQKQSKKFVQAPQQAELYCVDVKEEEEEEETEETEPAPTIQNVETEEEADELNKKQNNINFQKIFFADFESFTVDQNGNNPQENPFVHAPFLLCYNSYDSQTKKLTEPRNGRNIYSLLNHIHELNEEIILIKGVEYNAFGKEIKNKYLVYFHNLSYDASFIIKQQLNISSFLMVDGSILQFSLTYKNKSQIIFRDSNRIFAAKLNKLPKMFLTKDEQKLIFKEIFPYQYYNKSNYIKNVGDIRKAFETIHGETYEDFITSLTKADALINTDKFDMQKYALYYCNQDVNVLSKCMIKFQEMLQAEFNLQLFDFISISSLSLEYQKQKGCFKNCRPVRGFLRQYFQQFIVGGRVMVRDNKKCMFKNCKISDFDAVSLYPSAQKRLYYPTGLCYTLSQEQIEYYNKHENLFKITEAKDSEDQNTLYLTVVLKQGPEEKFIKRSFPLLSSKNEDGIRMFKNEVIQECYNVNQIDLQDLITFQGYEYQILSGVYFKERNYEIQTVISEMFGQRVKYKKEKNPCQNIYKLMLNSSYGKTCEGLHDIMYKILSEYQFKPYIFKHYNVIDSIEKIGDKYFVKENVETNKESAFTYIGSLILSMSKRIMNEVMCLAEDNGIKIFITDTDSMHIQTDDIPKLGQLFSQKYDRELIGEQQGQFHSDFESEKGKVLYADASVFLGKKFYIDRLLIKYNNDQNSFVSRYTHDYHIRGKGLSTKCIIFKAQELGITVLELYERLFNDEEIEFDLCANHEVKFKKEAFGYSTINTFPRKVSFRSTKEKTE